MAKFKFPTNPVEALNIIPYLEFNPFDEEAKETYPSFESENPLIAYTDEFSVIIDNYDLSFYKFDSEDYSIFILK
jgi:hypothetical protein